MITYGSLISWPKGNQRQAVEKLSNVQRLACHCINETIRGTPMAAIETLLNLLPLDTFIKGEARMGAYRLKYDDSWRNLEHRHSRITNVITNTVLEMGSDYVLPIYSFEKPFDIQMNWED
jgi:hypothetical protein